MLEGYFKISVYAELCGIKIDTAWHRVLRGGVDSIIGKDGARYVYYNEAINKEYISLRNYASLHGVSYAMLYERIRREIIKEPCIRKNRRRIFIRRNYDWTDSNRFVKRTNTKMLQDLKPDGYLTIKEWCHKTGVLYNTARNYIARGKIKCIRVNGHRYIPKDFTYAYTYIRNKNKGLNECE